ncbi:uncharacterized protein LOC143854432 [Tasmannia lanceolata]|uniref:uncharacterized protein LOC143854432 n=1 Tax=Tasmannia lanceolata TaxID=3420 RepID=UPI004062AC6C
MADVNTDIGRKRRLPLWMLGVKAADQQRESRNEDENHASLEEQPSPKAARKTKTITKKPVKKVITREVEALEVDSGFLARCETKKRTRRSSREDAKPNNSMATFSEVDVQKKKVKLRRGAGIDVRERTAPKANPKSCELESSEEIDVPSPTEGSEDGAELSEEERSSAQASRPKANPIAKRRGKKALIRNRVSPKKKNPKSYEGEISEEIETPSPAEESEDGVELTMEDLMSMAKEYVKADKGNELQQATTTKPTSKAQYPSTSIFSRNQSRDSLKTTENIQGISPCTTRGPSSGLPGTVRKDKESSAKEDITINANRTGDPATDMLNLFLGPLLKKPQSEERNFESITEDMAWACDLSKPIKNRVVVEEEVPLSKKKSSLKDKVAMFLD